MLGGEGEHILGFSPATLSRAWAKCRPLFGPQVVEPESYFKTAREWSPGIVKCQKTTVP